MEHEERRHKFPKSERLKLKREIELLFNSGKHTTEQHIRMVYNVIDLSEYAAPKVLFSVPKRNFKRAVKRNVLKRRMREAYRLNKHILVEKMESKHRAIHIAFIYYSKTISDYSTIETQIRALLLKLAK